MTRTQCLHMHTMLLGQGQLHLRMHGAFVCMHGCVVHEIMSCTGTFVQVLKASGAQDAAEAQNGAHPPQGLLAAIADQLTYLIRYEPPLLSHTDIATEVSEVHITQCHTVIRSWQNTSQTHRWYRITTNSVLVAWVCYTWPAV